MSLTLLFDLDDTLLDTNMDAFLPAYFQAFSGYFADHVPPKAMLSALVSSTNLMYQNRNPARTLEEVFHDNFYRRLGVPKDELDGLVKRFYDEVFPALRVHTRQKPEAFPLIEWALSSGYHVAVATDPIFPCKAMQQRVRWAGLAPECFEFISTVESFHFSKTYPAYYAELLGRMGWPDRPVLVVGNDVERDMLPAQRLGLKTYLVDGESASTSGPFDAVHGRPEAGRGKLAGLRPWLESIELIHAGTVL